VASAGTDYGGRGRIGGNLENIDAATLNEGAVTKTHGSTWRRSHSGATTGEGSRVIPKGQTRRVRSELVCARLMWQTVDRSVNQRASRNVCTDKPLDQSAVNQLMRVHMCRSV
jgi:hypothetical protein